MCEKTSAPSTNDLSSKLVNFGSVSNPKVFVVSDRNRIVESPTGGEVSRDPQSGYLLKT